MLSIIISSADSTMLENISNNIEATIGVPYEILVFPNSGANVEGICAVYNKGIKKAKYDLLCFCHEDLIFRTRNWGAIVADIFEWEERNIGLLGVVGSTYKALTPSGWDANSASAYGISFDYANIIQSYKYKESASMQHYRNPRNEALSEVSVVDGMWFCVKREIAAKYKFDAETFTGFHCYDMDFSLAVGQSYVNMVTYDILIEHLSEGKHSKDWASDVLKLNKKWIDILPVNKENFNRKTMAFIEKRAFRYLIAYLTKYEFSRKIIIETLWKTKMYKINRFLFLKLYLNIYTNPYKNKLP